MILDAKSKAAEEEPKPEQTKAKTKRKKSSFELHEKFINEIKNDEKKINKQIFQEYFFIVLHYFEQNDYIIVNVNDQIVKHINDALIELKKDINRKKIPKNENANKIVDIVEKILNFNEQQKGKGLPSDLARIAHLAKISDHKVSDHSNKYILNKCFKGYQ